VLFAVRATQVGGRSAIRWHRVDAASGTLLFVSSVDPNDPTRFWTIQQVVSAPDVWSAQITELRIVPEPEAVWLIGVAIVVLSLRWRKWECA
jgi:hypothetical protein